MTQTDDRPGWATTTGHAVFDDLEIGEIAIDLDDQEPEDAIQWALDALGDRVAVVTALQADGMAVLDMAARIRPDVRVITVDTGRLPAQTHSFVNEVQRRYPETRWEVLTPDADEVADMVSARGHDLFRTSVSDRMRCCQVRKVRPLVGALRNLDGWFTGLRRDQWASRAAIKKVELDHDHGGIVKVNALADWESEEVWDYLREFDVPVHPLYAEGYTSFGCAPCTRPVQPGESERAGRWWWETGAPKECGIHCPIETGSFEHEAAELIEH